MTAMTRVTDSAGRTYRICKQSSQVTCGPAACLIMWANVNNADPIADEGGVIALSRQFADSWTQAKGANIANLVQVMAQMGMQTALARHRSVADLKSALLAKVQEKKPALAFLEWESEASVVGHFVVVGAARSGDRYTLLDPNFGMQEMTGLPFYQPTDDDSLKFSGAVATLG